MDAVAEAQLDEMFSAMANVTRRAIVLRLAQGEATVNEIAEPFDIALPAVSKHLTVLERAGVITRGRRAQFRPCRLNPEVLDLVSGWASTCRAVWEGRLDRMTDHLDQVGRERARDEDQQGGQAHDRDT
ncbi:ArsR/SmtB family transcription factor [Jannaschia sp. R86511]|uniref:ArsR/SmtB family transcription factor n=1 Tax=Jannaschia sp. R86511 TaxID=3093853 RepID=UPI0036D371EE